MRHLTSLGLALCLGGSLGGDVAAQSGPGIPNVVFPQNELFTIVSTIGSGSYGHSFLHDGWVAALRSGNGVQFFDFSDPYSPQLVRSITGNGMDLSEPHTYAQTDAWGGKHVVLMRGPGGLGGTGFSISDWSDIFNPRVETSYSIPGVPGGYASGVFWLFVQAPYIYVPVGSLGLAIIDASDPTNPVVANMVSKSQLGGFNTVVNFAIGNVLILTNSDSGSGFARLDISDPRNPVLLNSIPGPIIPYGAQINAGKLIVPAVSGCAACSGGGNGAFHIHDMFAPGFPIIGETSLPSRGGSAVVQDQFVHIAASTYYQKLDVTNNANFTLAGQTRQPISGGDWDWVSPIGNFAILGDDQGQATHVIPHQRLPDTVGPSVTMVVPADSSIDQALTSRVGITTSDMIEMGSIGTSSFIVRPLGGQALEGSYSNQFGIVNFFPAQALQPSTTYEVVIPAGGMKDWAGNGMTENFVSQFSTGTGTNRIFVTVQTNPPTEVGTPMSFNVASVTGVGPFQYSWDFGDGTPPTAPSSNSQATHTYADGGHYSVLCTVTNGTAEATDSYLQTAHYAATSNRPTHSSTIALHQGRTRVFCVNPDNDTYTSIHKLTKQKLKEVAVGDHPRTLAFAPDETTWIVCQDDATVHVHNLLNYSSIATIQLPPGSAPYGIAMSPDGSAAYVTLQATGQVAKLDIRTRRWVATTPVGPDPRGIAISGDSRRIFVTRFRSSSQPRSLTDDSLPAPLAEVYELTTEPFTKVRTIGLRLDPGPDTEATGRGLPNYLNSLTISRDGRRLWVPSKKDNIERGGFRSEQKLTFENTVRTISSQINLATNREDRDARIDFNDRDLATAVAFPSMSDYAFHAIQGSNAIEIRDSYSGDLVADIAGTGLAPQGLAIEEDDTTLWVHNFMSRTVTAYDVSGVTSSTTFVINQIATIRTVADETLSPQVLLGKQIFYNADEPRMNEDGYLSCASCHLDGGQDGQVWDFSDRGEGLRNTISLHGRAGTGHGNVHWTANFDEIQDFENDIRQSFGGDGFMSNAQFNSGTVSNPLGQPKAGLSPELDALAAYVSSLTTFGRSPHRTASGASSAAGQRGRTVFEQLNCAQCHSGQNFTDGQIHDVGTRQPGSGRRIGGPLPGFDTPTLRGLWNTAPYLHNGSAATLMDVITTRNLAGQHGGTTNSLTLQQRQDLVAYLLQIDDLEPAAR